MKCQPPSQFHLETRWIGGLPIINALLQRLDVDALLSQAFPAPDVRAKIAPSAALGVLLRNIILNDRQPLYTQGEWVAQAELALLGLKADQLHALNDDRIGRALDLLFEADRASLMTELVMRAIREEEIIGCRLVLIYWRGSSQEASRPYPHEEGGPCCSLRAALQDARPLRVR